MEFIQTDREWKIDLLKQEEEKIQDKIREIAIESLKSYGDLPVDYIRKV